LVTEAAVDSVFAQLEDRHCPVCGASPHQARLFLEASYDAERIGDFSFASRKSPEFMSYRLLRCDGCATVYAQAAPPASVLAAAYKAASYDSTEEASLAADTYVHAMRDVIAGLPQRGRALEIGTGTGVLLERLLDAGFGEVVGVEPSPAAIAAASPRIRPHIREGVFAEADFAGEKFDLICCFMTLEHVADPRPLTAACLRLLRPGGVLAFVTHDYAAPLNRMLGRRSPIIDIEHLQIFCPQSLVRLLTDAGFADARTAPIVNTYPLRYWIRLTPLPASVKPSVLNALETLHLGGLRISVGVGNIISFGTRAAA
jgi:SAM-dependent methyltransferase